MRRKRAEAKKKYRDVVRKQRAAKEAARRKRVKWMLAHVERLRSGDWLKSPEGKKYVDPWTRQEKLREWRRTVGSQMRRRPPTQREIIAAIEMREGTIERVARGGGVRRPAPVRPLRPPGPTFRPPDPLPEKAEPGKVASVVDHLQPIVVY
jgi:hypothetical protein